MTIIKTRSYGETASEETAWRAPILTAAAFALPAAAAAGLFLFCPPIAQDPAYHRFADQRTILGIPHFGDVVTNAGFVIVGLWGLGFLRRHRGVGPGEPFAAAADRLPALILFAGLALTGLGSAYYHWAPDSETLLWDRLPLTLVFMALFSQVVGELLSARWGARLLPVLLAAGAASVVYWHVGERSGAGDLRPYALVQFGPMAAMPLILLAGRPRYTYADRWWGVLLAYALAKGCELLDPEIYALTGIASGHNLKHVAAALAAWGVLRMLQRRQARPCVSRGRPSSRSTSPGGWRSARTRSSERST